MRERFPSLFSPGSLDSFTFRERWTIRIADLAFFVLIRVVCSTLTYSAENENNYEDIIAAGNVPILAFWHDRIFAGIYYFRGRDIAVLTSRSKDGEYIARFILRFGFGTIRGSSSRGGVRGLVEMIKVMRAGVPMAFALDGPRGPRYKAKKGPAMLAKKTGNPILPFSVEYSSYWQLKSWDRLRIPKPFAKACVFFAEPIFVSDKGGEEEIEAKRIEIQTSLDKLVRRGEAWRVGS